ncbi:MAG TPA: BamA/TamA family outer membrane protein [Gemmatimonadales bacterium]
MRLLWLPLLVAVVAAAPLAAQQEPRVVRGLSFEGNHALDALTLETAIATPKSGYFARQWWLRWLGLGEKRYFDEVEFRRDVVRLVLLYRQSGYMDVAVDTVVRRSARDVWVTFRIVEGEPVRVTRIDIQGLDSVTYDLKKLRRELPLHVGDAFDRYLFQASADTIASRLRNRGFPYTQVLRNFDSDAAAHTAQVTFDVEPGPHARIGDVLVQGLERIDTATVLRVLSVRPGDAFRQDQFYQSQRDLYGLGVFRAASVGVMDTAPRSPDDSLVRVLVRVVEGPRHGIRFGVGYGSVDCFRVQTGWVARNFLGGARSLDVSGRVSKIGVGYPLNAGFKDKRNDVCGTLKEDDNSDTLNYSAGVTLTQPAFLSPRHAASVGLFAERRSEFQAYTRQAIGANLALTLNARRNIPVTLGYTISVGQTTANPASFCVRFRVCADSDQAILSARRRFAAVTVTAVRDRVNSILDPTEGSLATLSVGHTSRAVGSDPFYEFNRGELEISKYYPLGRRGTFAWRVRGGTILPQSITLSGQRVQLVPPDQRFYAGGPNSVRGYGRNELGPRVYVTDSIVISGPDTTILPDRVHPEPTGGNTVFVMNAELRFATPLFPQRMRVGLFVDAGQVWERGQEAVTLQSLRVTPGVGLRFTTPLGPVRLDAAYKNYADEPGPLLYNNGTTLTQIRPSYSVAKPSSFWRRIVFQFAVGQAF